MAKPMESYRQITVESYLTLGSSGSVHIRPISGQYYPTDIRVQCSRELTDLKKYPLGTRFKIRAKLTDRGGEGEYLSSHHKWPFEVM